MTYGNLEQRLQAHGNTVDLLRNVQSGPRNYPGTPAEYTNWRDEQRAWAETAALFNQTHHMSELEVRGPDAAKMLSYLAVNSFANMQPDRAKQFVSVSPDGYVIGDVVLFERTPGVYELVGRDPILNWATFHASTGEWDVEVELDPRGTARTDGLRRQYRFQIQGPNARSIMQKVLGREPQDIGFFRVAIERIGGCDVRALRHGMAGQPGWELFGPWADRERVYDALVSAGADYGLKLVGGRTYASNTLESGWIPSPLPAIYTGDGVMQAYREWLSVDHYEANASIGGSFVSDRIEDYYLTPWDLSYGGFVNFDHDFIGREALQRLADAGGHRTKVTLALEDEDVVRAIASQFGPVERRAKYFDTPSAVYALHPYDEVLVDGRRVGLSTWVGYSANEGKMLTLAMVDAEHAEPGTEVVLVWGEPDGGTSKPTVEPHVQTEIRAIVSPVPYSKVARTEYAPESWRAVHV